MILTDIRLAARALIKDRSFALAAVLALALGIAANTTVFTLVNGIFLRDLPFADPNRVVAIGTVRRFDSERQFDNMSVPDFRDIQAGARGFAGIAAVDEVPMTVNDVDRPVERIAGAYITANGFDLLGVAPALGRSFTGGDDVTGADPVVILGAELWRNWYGGDREVLGRTLRVDGAAATIVGIMPDGFGFPTSARLWLPLGVRGGIAQNDRAVRNIDVFGRMAAGVTMTQATTELTRVMDLLERDHPDTNAGIGPRVRPFRDTNTSGPIRITFWAFAGSVAILLFIACANVANLLLARSAGRARDMALRLSLGASRGRLIAHLLTESLILSSAATAVGLPLSLAGVRVLHAAIRGTGEPYWLAFPYDLRVLGFTVGITTITAVLFGLVPALQTTRRSLVEVLGDGNQNVTGNARSGRWIGGLLIAQVALAMTLLTGAGLMLRNLQVQLGIDAGVDTSGLLVMQVDLSERNYPDAAARRRFYERLDEQLASLPGVTAGTGTWAPLGGAFYRAVTIEGGPLADDASRRPRVSNLMVGATYFDAIGIRPVRGRLFTPADGTSGLPVAIVNERFARRFFGDDDPLGRRVALDGQNSQVPASGELTIVGVVPNVRHDESDARVVEAVVYLPNAALPLPFGRIVARGGDTAGVTAAVRAALGRVDPSLPAYNAAYVRDTLAEDLWPYRVFGTMFAVFAAAALLVLAVGLYGVTTYAAALRVRELGLRIALGASAAHVRWVVTRRALWQVAAGLALGSIGAALAGFAVRRLLFSISPYDPVTLAAVAVACITAALAACVGPAQRAIRTDPASVLRQS